MLISYIILRYRFGYNHDNALQRLGNFTGDEIYALSLGFSPAAFEDKTRSHVFIMPLLMKHCSRFRSPDFVQRREHLCAAIKETTEHGGESNPEVNIISISKDVVNVAFPSNSIELFNEEANQLHELYFKSVMSHEPIEMQRSKPSRLNQKKMIVMREISFSSSVLPVLPIESVQSSKRNVNDIKRSSREDLMCYAILRYRFNYESEQAKIRVTKLTIDQKYALCCGFSPEVFEINASNSCMTLAHLYKNPPRHSKPSFPDKIKSMNDAIVEKAQEPTLIEGTQYRDLSVPLTVCSVSRRHAKSLFQSSKETNKEVRSLEKAYFSEETVKEIQSWREKLASQKNPLSGSVQPKICSSLVPVSRT
ncbi:MAG: hypothetical protein IPP74_11865 [Alphaproteobacteria bacterium]|nr:hypothetical protein [Alphaproteobacteria bacterium]